MHKIFKVKNPIKKIIFTLIYLIIILFFYYNGGNCVYKRFLGINCPGCGLTTAYLRLFELDIIGAFKSNFMFWGIPILYLYCWFDGKLIGKKSFDLLVIMIILFGFLLKWIITLLL